jgi:LacI family transcriptional regulator
MRRSRKQVRLRDIAAKAGVSLGTVSMALAGHPSVSLLTREKVQALSVELGYQLPRGTRVRTSVEKAVKLGLVLLGSPRPNELLFSTIGSFASKMRVRCEFIVLEDTTDSQANADSVLRFARRVDGVVLTGTVHSRVQSMLEVNSIPHVILGYTIESPSTRSQFGQIVTYDMAGMGALATEYCIKHGHRRIGFICERLVPNLWSARWLRGYHSKNAEHGIGQHAELIYVASHHAEGRLGAAPAMLKLKPKPDAYIIPDTNVAATFLTEMKSLGVAVPGTALVISGPRQRVEEYGLDTYPWIGPRMDWLAAVTIRQIRSLIETKMPCATEVYVPFETLNMDR